MSLFITFEGPEGSGKSTQITPLADRLRALGHDVCLTREPGGTDIGDQIRQVLHDLKNTAMQPRAEILLYSASRAQLVGEIIRPHLERGGIVLCDRYADSTMAYQGYGHGLDLGALRAITEFATGGLKPDLTILLDVETEEGLRRRRSSGEWNRLDAYALAFHQRVRQGYLGMAAAEPERWVVVDAGRAVEEVAEEVWRGVSKRLEGSRK
ncbi:MAG: dTMP kinase [Chloroflexi bacterium]|nr:dTMP kinase [Chloroflexota bacterium]